MNFRIVPHSQPVMLILSFDKHLSLQEVQEKLQLDSLYKLTGAKFFVFNIKN